MSTLITLLTGGGLLAVGSILAGWQANRFARQRDPAIAAKVQAANAASLDQLTGLFTAGIAAGQWPSGTDPALRARLFLAGVYGLMSQWHTAPGSFCLEAAMGALAGTGAAGPSEHRGDTQKKGDGT